MLTGKITHHREFERVKSILFSPKCGLLVAFENRGRITLWDSEMKRMMIEFQYELKDTMQNDDYLRCDCITYLCFSTDSSLLAVSFLKSGIWIWETASGNLLQKFATETCYSMAFSADNEKLFACLISKKVFMLSVSGEDSEPSTDHRRTDKYGWAKFSPDAKFFIISSGDYRDEILVWNSISRISTAMRSGYYPILSPDSTRLAYAGELSLKIWSITSCPPKLFFQKKFAEGTGFSSLIGIPPELQFEMKSIGGTATLSRDWKQMAIASKSGTIRIWDTSSGKRLWKLKDDVIDGRMLLLMFSLDGKSLAAFCLEPWRLGVWDLVSGTRTTIAFQEVTSPECFHFFVAWNDCVRHLKSLPSPKQTLKSIFDSTKSVQNLGLPANTSNCGFTNENTWVTNNKKRVLWLPPRYRPVSQTNWDSNDRFIGIHTHQILVIEFCCNMCSAKVSSGSKETTLCKQNFTGRYKKEPKNMSAGNPKAIIGYSRINFLGSSKIKLNWTSLYKRCIENCN